VSVVRFRPWAPTTLRNHGHRAGRKSLECRRPCFGGASRSTDSRGRRARSYSDDDERSDGDGESPVRRHRLGTAPVHYVSVARPRPVVGQNSIRRLRDPRTTERARSGSCQTGRNDAAKASGCRQDDCQSTRDIAVRPRFPAGHVQGAWPSFGRRQGSNTPTSLCCAMAGCAARGSFFFQMRGASWCQRATPHVRPKRTSTALPGCAA